MKKFYGLDIETWGDEPGAPLEPFRVLQGKARITAISVVDEEGNKILSVLEPSPGEMQKALHYVEQEQGAIVAWHQIFELGWLYAAGIDTSRVGWYDAKLMNQFINNQPDRYDYGLKRAVKDYLPAYGGYEESVGGDFSKIDETLLHYNYLDAMLTAKLARQFYDKLNDREWANVVVMSRCSEPLAQRWVKGIHVSREAAAEYRGHCVIEAAKGAEEAGLTPQIMKSPAQLKRAIQDDFGLPISGTSKVALYEHLNDPRVAGVARFRKANTGIIRLLASLDKSLAHCDNGDKVHPSPRLFGTYTGRCTYTSTQTVRAPGKRDGTTKNAKIAVGVPIHQIPKEKLARNIIAAPPGYLLAECDFQAQESRILADFSGDETLLNVFRDGLDFHSVMGATFAEIAYGDFIALINAEEPSAKRYRNCGKVANLSLSYRTGVNRLLEMARVVYHIDMTLAEAERLHALFRRMYPGVVKYWYRAVDFAKRHKFIETRGGKRLYLPNWQDKRWEWKSGQSAINYPIQGTGADMKCLGLALLTGSVMPEYSTEFAFDLHDGLYFYVPDNSRAEDAVRAIGRMLNNLPYKQVFDWQPKVAMPVEAKLGKSWGQLKGVKLAQAA